ncbi:hypothetical protein ACQPXT_23015 [Streptomyces sp. CA-100214]
MGAGWCLRTTRAAVFAAVCVLLAALGHVMMSGLSVPWWALAVGVVTCGGTGWCLARRERGVLLVAFIVVVAQSALHEWFSYAQALSAPSLSLGGTADDVFPMLSSASTGHTGHATHSMTRGGPAMESADGMDPMTGADHMMGGGMGAGMLAAHLLAALLSGLWLAHGERAAFRILRAVTGWLAAPLRLLLALPATPRRPRLLRRRGRTDRRPHRLLLVYAITSRGPPTGTAVR